METPIKLDDDWGDPNVRKRPDDLFGDVDPVDESGKPRNHPSNRLLGGGIF